MDCSWEGRKEMMSGTQMRKRECDVKRILIGIENICNKANGHIKR